MAIDLCFTNKIFYLLCGIKIEDGRQKLEIPVKEVW